MANAPHTSRRALLKGAPAAAAAFAALPAAYGSAWADETSAENPDLLALSADLPALLHSYVEARDDVEWIIAEYAPLWPVPGEELHRYGGTSKTYRGIDGRGIERPWGKGGLKRVPEIGTPEGFEASFQHYKREAERRSAFKTQRGMAQYLRWAEKEKAQIEPARAFWAEIDKLTEASGVEGAKARKVAAQDALATHVDAIMKADALTLAGLVIKAQAMEAWAKVEKFWRVLDVHATDWADAMSASILRVHGAA